MSRIKDALEKAKKEKSLSKPFSHPATRTVDKDIPAVQTEVLHYSEEAVKKHLILTPYVESHEQIEAFKLLRTKMLSDTRTRDERNILITSTLEGEGKTHISINLAITFAREVDQTVLLVDVNLKNPSILKYFGIEKKEGLTDYLLHDKPLAELLVRPGIEKLTVLPAGKPVGNAAELLRSLKMQELVKEMKNRYSDRYVFFDAPAVLGTVDTMVLSEYVDRLLYVVEAGRVPPQRYKEALDNLDQKKIIGTVLNHKS